MQGSNSKWVILIALSIIWGSSYILIKKGLEGFTPLQLGAVRIVLSSIFLFLIGYKTLFSIRKSEWPWVALSAACGTFFPVFLFSYAETQIDSSIVSILNSLVPLFTMLLGYLLFSARFTVRQVVGVIIGLAGALLLILQGAKLNPNQNYLFSGLVIIAAICYAANANIIKAKLQGVSPRGIAVGNFAVMVVPALILAVFTGVFNTANYNDENFIQAMGYIAVLAVIGTGISKILFNKLIQISGAIFSTSVTYLIPVVGIFWGIIDGEKFNSWQGIAAVVISIGVYLVNVDRKKRIPRR